MDLECVLLYLVSSMSAGSYAFIIGQAVVEMRKAFSDDN